MKYVLIVILTVTVTLLGMPTPDAIVYVPSDYTGQPLPVLYWLHWYGGTASNCPYTAPENCIVVAPVFRREADWQNYDLLTLIKKIEAKYPTLYREVEGYSRGAYGAAWHASQLPGLFSRVTAIAGGYPDFPEVENLRLIAGSRDRWLADSERYAAFLGIELEIVDSTHDPWEFYGTLTEKR